MVDYIVVGLKREIWKQQDGRCAYCGIVLVPPVALRGFAEERACCVCGTCHKRRGRGFTNGMDANWACVKAHLDHITPRLLGGQSVYENLAYACTVCNQKRRWFLLCEQEGKPMNDELFSAHVKKMWLLHNEWQNRLRADGKL